MGVSHLTQKDYCPMKTDPSDLEPGEEEIITLNDAVTGEDVDCVVCCRIAYDDHLKFIVVIPAEEKDGDDVVVLRDEDGTISLEENADILAAVDEFLDEKYGAV